MTAEQIKNVEQTLKELKEINMRYTLYGNGYEVASIKEATEVTVTSNDFYDFNIKTIKIPKKKPFTKDYVLEKMYPLKKEYENHSELFNKLSDYMGLKSLYGASYGLAFDGLFRKREEVFKLKDEVIKKLNDLGIKATFSFSDAMWVLQIKISKSEKNIARIQKIIASKRVA